ncbi:amidase [Aureimonas ureilytica]|uniref:amidase n=1 Tax=Aureimonas ureilytica TaxID=401562 RepID=UPI0003604289|nr:amidase [Aureimonas ureilytica]
MQDTTRRTLGFPPVSLEALLERIGTGRSTPAREIGEAYERILAADAEVSSFSRLAPTERFAAPATAGPLAGVALGVKDMFDTFDMVTDYGSPIHAGHQPPADAALVAQARALGATIAGKTVTTEFAFASEVPTRNPHHPDHTPGASSAGSAAAVAAGLVPAALGSQTAGSVIRPASFCGVAGFKPSFRLLPTVGLKSFAWSLDTAGLFAAGVRDVALLADHLSGRPLRIRDDDGPRLRVGLYRSTIDGQLHPAMLDAWERAAHALEACGCTLLDIEESETLAAARTAQGRIQLFEGAVSLLHEHRHHGERMNAGLRAILAEGAAIPPGDYDQARRAARAGRRETTRLFDLCDILLAPSAPGPAPHRDEGMGDPAFNRLWTLAGVPCVNVPVGRTEDGLPLGVSVIARFGQDARALAAAALLEGRLALR